ncbi:MAG: HAD family phosphatase [Blautia sp.]|nr:HAD family phosphatase [Blautia sp.]
MNNKKLFLTDLDGTLLNDQNVVSPATRKALEDFTAAGNVFAISTGRAMESVLHVVKELELSYPGMYILSYNGALIYDCDAKKSLFRASIPFDAVQELLDMANERDIHIQTYTDRYIVAPAYNEHLDFYRIRVQTPVIIDPDIVSELPEPPCKMLAVERHDHAKLERLRTAIHERYGDRFTTIYSNQYLLEIVPAEAGKGNALVRLRDHLGILPQNTMAAGDAENDISMIEAAGLGIAMKNGSDEAKAAADVVTKEDNNHDGLVPFLAV